MQTEKKKLLVVQVAGLGWNLLESASRRSVGGMDFRPAAPMFPGVTCTVQASMRTAASPAGHGFPANGFFDRGLRRALFWEQSAGLVDGPRFWDGARARGATVAILFWQQSLGENADIILSPAPIHKHGGGMLPSCYSRPADLYERLARRVGARFRLRDYWGPLASRRSTDWIAAAIGALLESPEAPDLCLGYLPLLDYDQQRHGPEHPRVGKRLHGLLESLETLSGIAARNGYEVVFFGDYAIVAADGGALYPNRSLRREGLFRDRAVAGRSYPDLYASPAFALADHEIAPVYAATEADIEAAARVLKAMPGVEKVFDRRHPGPDEPPWAGRRAGDLLAVAAPGHWFSYKWWEAGEREPDFAGHVDIHAKPGFDPCELFFGWPPGSVSRNDRVIGGTHGRSGPGREVALATSHPRFRAASLMGLAEALRDWAEAL